MDLQQKSKLFLFQIIFLLVQFGNCTTKREATECPACSTHSYTLDFLISINPSKMFCPTSSHHIFSRTFRSTAVCFGCSFTTSVVLENSISSGSRSLMNACKSSSVIRQPSLRDFGGIRFITPVRNHLRTLFFIACNLVLLQYCKSLINIIDFHFLTTFNVTIVILNNIFIIQLLLF
jgi:hypothetical protein